LRSIWRCRRQQPSSPHYRNGRNRTRSACASEYQESVANSRAPEPMWVGGVMPVCKALTVPGHSPNPAKVCTLCSTPELKQHFPACRRRCPPAPADHPPTGGQQSQHHHGGGVGTDPWHRPVIARTWAAQQSSAIVIYRTGARSKRARARSAESKISPSRVRRMTTAGALTMTYR
jgi:hypothetical protein